MRYSQSEKMEIIRTVENSSLGAKRTLVELDINRSTFYDWYRRYREGGYDALASKPPHRRRFWNAIPPDIKQKVVDTALEHLDKSPRQPAWYLTDTQGYYISESERLPYPQGQRSDYKSELHGAECQRQVRSADNSRQPAVADRFHLFEGDPLGLVLPVNGAG